MREAVLQTLAELLGDPDEGLELCPDFAEEAQRSLAAVKAGAQTIPRGKSHRKTRSALVMYGVEFAVDCEAYLARLGAPEGQRGLNRLW